MIATKEKRVPKSERLPGVVAAVQYFDRLWFAERTRIKQAKKTLAEIGIDPKGISLNAVAKEHCEFWRVEKYRKPLGRRCFNSGEWESMRKWLAAPDRIDPERDTFYTVLARMRNEGVRASVSGLTETLLTLNMTLPFKLKPFKVASDAPTPEPEQPTAPAEKAAPKLTPAMKQYQQFKSQYPGFVLFFRMGDFYEMFGEDAQLCAKTLGITLTKRVGPDGELPMAGLPFHAVEGYLRKMIAAGHKVAICEQVDSPTAAKGTVKREVRTVTGEEA